MSRLGLVIADSDMDYLTKFEKFLMANYPQRFDIFSFSSPGKLTEFLCTPEKRDILLINSKMYNKELHSKNFESLILLSGDDVEPIPEGFEMINKYQHAERLVTDILRLYAARSLKNYSISGHGDTRIVCVYSPAGGTGKTSVAAGSSILCSRRGLKTFYLNLEDIPSTNLYFYGESEQSFSNVIYHLKGKGKNLGLKLEGAKCCDSKTGVHFFTPPESILEMEELSEQDIVRLLNEFRANATYDVVFIDMSCGLSQRNAAILASVDSILLVLAPGDISTIKMNALKTGMDLLEHKYGVKLGGRTVTILNRNDRKTANMGAAHTFNDSKPVIEIVNCLPQGLSSNAVNLVENVAFLSGLNRLLEAILPQAAIVGPLYGGGEFIA